MEKLSLDAVVDGKSLGFKAVNDENVPVLAVVGEDTYPLTRWAFGQVLTRAGLRPWVAYALAPEDTALFLEKIFACSSKEYLVRIYDGHVRALLSSDYCVLDDSEFDGCIEASSALTLKSRISCAGRERLEMNIEVAGDFDYRGLEAGVYVSNSEVGACFPSTCPFVRVQAGSREVTIPYNGMLTYYKKGISATDMIRGAIKNMQDAIDSTYYASKIELYGGAGHNAQKICRFLRAQELSAQLELEIDYLLTSGHRLTVVTCAAALALMAEDQHSLEKTVQIRALAGNVLSRWRPF